MNLLDYRRNITSEHGEDGILERLFEVLGEGSHYCIELGALDGKHGSNVWHLVHDKKWSALLIEADPTYFEKLQARFAGRPDVICVNAFVSFEGSQTLDCICERVSAPHEPDLLSLDIDGNDYHVWESFSAYRPRVVVVEFNPSIPNHISFIQSRDMRVQQGSSIKALVELGRKKGYELVAVTDTNAVFVLQELFGKFGISDNSLGALRTGHRYETVLFQLYDGTLVIEGNKELIWHHVPIDAEQLQVLPPSRRKYPARTSPEGGVRQLKYYIRKLPLYFLMQKIRKLFL